MTYDPSKARTKRPLPIWVDAFVRDTLDLTVEQIGAYNLILWAMWTRDSCDLPDDDKVLATICRVTPTRWKRNFRPVLERYFDTSNGSWISKRLLKEAAYQQGLLDSQSKKGTRSAQKQSKNSVHGVKQKDDQEKTKNENIKEAKFSDKPLKNNEPPSTVDITAVTTVDTTGEQPRLQPRDQPPNYPITQHYKIDDDDAGAREDEGEKPRPFDPAYREAILTAIGADPVSGIASPNGRMLGGYMDMLEAARWRDELGLTTDEVVGVISDIRSRYSGKPIFKFSYFTQPMTDFADAKNRQLIPSGEPANDRGYQLHNGRRHDPVRSAHQGLIDSFSRVVSQRQARSRQGEDDS